MDDRFQYEGGLIDGLSRIPSIRDEIVRKTMRRYLAEVERLCGIAFPLGFRVAVRERPLNFAEIALRGPQYVETIHWEFVMLAPGEGPPDCAAGRWTIYENREGVPTGRSATPDRSG